MKGNNKKRVKLVQEVNARRIQLLVYAAFFLGFEASYTGRSLDNPDNFKEIHGLIDLITKN